MRSRGAGTRHYFGRDRGSQLCALPVRLRPDRATESDAFRRCLTGWCEYGMSNGAYCTSTTHHTKFTNAISFGAEGN